MVMELVQNLQSLAQAVRCAKSHILSRGEKINFLNQTVLAVCNILDIAVDSGYREYGLHAENIMNVENQRRRQSGELTTSIVQLHMQRLAFKGNDATNTSWPHFLMDAHHHISEALPTCTSIDERAVSRAFTDMASVLEDLCVDEWMPWSVTSDHSRQEQDTNVCKSGGEAGDPFRKECDVDQQKMMQQLRAVRDRCKKLAECDSEGSKLRSCKRNLEQTRTNENQSAGVQAETRAEGSESLGHCTADEWIWRVQEGLSGYEDSVKRLLSERRDWLNDEWIETLEASQEMLVDHRTVQRLFETGLEFLDESAASKTKSSEMNHKRFLKLTCQCFAALPLTLQCKQFQWLWEQPNGPALFQGKGIVDYKQELTQIFNRLVTGSEESQVIEIAEELCGIALHSPACTLKRAIQEGVSSTDAGLIICRVLRCIPFLLHLGEGARPYFLMELQRFVTGLADENPSAAEELNILSFFDELLKPYPLPRHPGSNVTCPSLLTPLELAGSCIWPFLTPTVDNHPLVAKVTSLHPQERNGLGGGGEKDARLYFVLKLLDLVLDYVIKSSSKQGSSLFGHTDWVSTMLCLCQLLDQGNSVGEESNGRHSVPVQELITGLVWKLANFTKNLERENLSLCVAWLLEETSDMHWTIRLTLDVLFSDVSARCVEDINTCIGEIYGSLSQPSSVPQATSVPLHLTWVASLVASFQAFRISPRLTKIFIQNLPRDLRARLSSSCRDFYWAICLALSQVLPHSTSHEWENVQQAVELLVGEGLLHVSYTSRFLTSLPMCDLTSLQHPLQLSQVFLTTIQLLSRPECVSQLSAKRWQHTTRNYAHITKDILNSAMECQTTRSTGSAHFAVLILIGQLFCQSCEVITCVPVESGEQMFVWCLELLMRMDDVVNDCGNVDGGDEGDAHREKRASFDTTHMTRSVQSVPNLEQKRTLEQKISALSLL